jgi:phosphotransferase system  glucose/maltose/N-acetylglucosamine-specific IIC component
MTSQRSLVNRVGIFVLFIGMVSAGIVYWSGESRSAKQEEVTESGSYDDTLSSENSKTSSRGTEMYFGKVGVLIAAWFRRWEELKDSERWAIMIASGSVFVGLICFVVATRLFNTLFATARGT